MEPLARQWRADGFLYLVSGDQVVVGLLTRSLGDALVALAESELQIPAEGVPDLVDRLPVIASALPLTLSDDFVDDLTEADPEPLLLLEVKPSGALDVRVRCRPLRGGATRIPGEQPEVVYAHGDAGTRGARRDLRAELARALAVLDLLGLEEEEGGERFVWYLDDPQVALGLVSRVMEEPALRVEWTRGQPHIVTPGLEGLSVRVRRQRDWFALGGELEVGEQAVPLADLLRAIRERRHFVRVAGGEWVRITGLLRERLRLVGDLADARGDRLSLYAAPALAGLEEEGADLDVPPEWRILRERLEEAAALNPALPEGLRAELRPYQREGFRWMVRLAHWATGACLADDMGLGKTLQALALLLHRQDLGPALVVAPTSVGFNWVAEAERYAPSLRMRRFRGVAELAALEDLAPGDVVVTSYGLLPGHQEALAEIHFATVVLDEAHAIKNPATRRARAARGLEASFVLALTGTPVENRARELWSLFRVLAPGLLGSLAGFRERFEKPIELKRDAEARAALATRVRPFILRRVKSEVASELPARSDQRVEIELSGPERKLYDQTRASVLQALAGQDASEDAPGRRFQVLAAMTQLRQLACHPKLARPESKVGSTKLAVLVESLQSLIDEGHRSLVFSQFTRHLALVREALAAKEIPYRYLDGSMSASARQREVEAFQAGAAPVFLLSLGAGGSGLNLTAANYVIHLDPWWNPAVEDQATDRAHRIGQTDPVTVLRLVAKDTIEEAILSLHADKRELVSALLDGTGDATALTTDELLNLL